MTQNRTPLPWDLQADSGVYTARHGSGFAVKAVKLLALTQLLAACDGPAKADFRFDLASPGRAHVASIMGHNTRDGYGKGYIEIKFNEDTGPSTSLWFVKNGSSGWVSNDAFAIVADDLEYKSVSNKYLPDGSGRKSVDLVFCSRQQMDCSSLETRLQSGKRPLNLPAKAGR